MPNTVLRIGEDAFNHNLEQVVFEQDSQLHTIATSAFRFTRLEDIIIPASVTHIGTFAFYGNNMLKTLTFEDGSSLKTIGDYAFHGTTKLKTVLLPDTVESIGQKAFSTSGITTFTISASSMLTTIGDLALFNTHITSIYLPPQLTTIGKGAFGVTYITGLFIPINVEVIGDSAFSFLTPDIQFTEIYVEAESKPEGWSDTWNSRDYPVYWHANE